MTPPITTVDCDYVRPALAAAYLREQGGEVAIVEANTALAAPKILAALAAQGLRREQVRWVIVTHAHLDHAGGAWALLRELPSATLVAHPRAARHLIDPSRLVASAKQVYGEAIFAALYGSIEPVDAARVLVADDGSTVQLGGASLQFFHTRGHANHHMIAADPSASAVFTGDTFGLVYPSLQRGRLLAFPSTSPTDFDAAEARKSVEKVLSLGASVAYPTHFGPVGDLAAVAAQLHRWIDLSEKLVDQAVAAGKPDEAAIQQALARRMAECAAEAGLALGANDHAMLELDLKLNAQGLAFAAQRRLLPSPPRPEA